MSLLDIFKKSKTKNEAIKSEIIEPRVITNGVNEKYLSYADDIVQLLISLLRRLDTVEKKAFVSDRENRDEYKELKKEYGRIANEVCTEELLERGYLISFGNPTKYGHINKGCELEFVMKSMKQATVIMYDEHDKSYLSTYRFVFKSFDGVWKLCSVHYRHGSDDTWHVNHI